MFKRIMLILLVFILIGGGAAAAIVFKAETKEVNPLTYFNEFKENQLNVVYEDTRVDMQQPIIEKDGMLYVSSEFTQLYIDEKIFYDEVEELLTITNLQEIRRFKPGEEEMVVNGEQVTLKTPLIKEGEKAYLPEDYLEEEYGFEIRKGKDDRLVVTSDLKVVKQLGEVKSKKAVLRTHPDRKALIIDKIEKGHQLVLYKEENGYIRVRDENGIIGFIAKSDVKETESTVKKEDKVYTLAPMQVPLSGKVKLVWDQMTVQTSGEWSALKYKNIQGANVISPTWFEFGDDTGQLIDRGSKRYVEEAHQRGMQVWALMSHNFSEPQLTKTILTSTAKRDFVIEQLLAAAKAYGFDGINIDIENIQPDFASSWIQFMRELSVKAKQAGLNVTVDVYMPSAWSGHYQRDKVAEVCDYFIVMAYDQHWSGSEQIGPVGSIDWVKTGLELNLEEVPKEKLVLGIPFYTRVWEQSAEGRKVASYGIAASQSIISDWGTEVVFDEVYGQKYIEKQGDGVTKNMWIEDAETVQKRVDIINEYDLAGYACWKLGLETKDIWGSLNNMKE